MAGTGTTGILGSSLESTLIDKCYTAASNTISPIVFTNTPVDFITNCYYNNNLYTDTCNNATGLTTSEMKSASFVTMLGSSFKADTNNINNGYPIFTWE